MYLNIKSKILGRRIFIWRGMGQVIGKVIVESFRNISQVQAPFNRGIHDIRFNGNVGLAGIYNGDEKQGIHMVGFIFMHDQHLPKIDLSVEVVQVFTLNIRSKDPFETHIVFIDPQMLQVSSFHVQLEIEIG